MWTFFFYQKAHVIPSICLGFIMLSVAENGWLLCRVVFHAADVNNIGGANTLLEGFKGKGNFIIICSSPPFPPWPVSRVPWPLCTQWWEHTHKVKQTNNKMASPADATSNNNNTGKGFLFISSCRCLVDQAKILIESTSTSTLFTSRQQRDCCSAPSLLWFLQLP